VGGISVDPEQCSAGSWSVASAAVCTPCAAGYFGAGTGATSAATGCAPCPAGSTPSADRTKCVMCGAGTYAATVASIACSQCAPSTWCPAGTSQPRALTSGALPALSAVFGVAAFGFNGTDLVNASDVSTTEALTPLRRAAAAMRSQLVDARPAGSIVTYGISGNVIPALGAIGALTALFLLLVKVIPGTFATTIDVFGLDHSWRQGQAVRCTKTQWGGTMTLAFLPVAICLIYALERSNVPVSSDALVPISSLTSNANPSCRTVRARTFEISVGFHSSGSAVGGAASLLNGTTASAECISWVASPGVKGELVAEAAKSPPPSDTLTKYQGTWLTYPQGGSCSSLRLICKGCQIAAGSSIEFTLPWTAALVEWQVYVSSAEMLRGTRLTSLIAADTSRDASTARDLQPLPLKSSLQFAITPSTLIDETVDVKSISASTAADYRSCGGKGAESAGYEVSYSSELAASTETAVQSAGKISVAFEFDVAATLYARTLAFKQSELQLVSAIASALLSLLALWRALFKQSERVLKLRRSLPTPWFMVSPQSER
jgi:hypothetical protein